MNEETFNLVSELLSKHNTVRWIAKHLNSMGIKDSAQKPWTQHKVKRELAKIRRS